MVPRITHRWMAQQLWLPLAGQWGRVYGEFWPGNLAPDGTSAVAASPEDGRERLAGVMG